MTKRVSLDQPTVAEEFHEVHGTLSPQVNYNGAPRRMTAVCLGSKCDAVSLWWFVMSGLAHHNWSKPSKTPWLMVLQVRKKIRLTKWWSGNQWETLWSIWKSLGIHWESLATSRQAFESRAARRGLEMVEIMGHLPWPVQVVTALFETFWK